MFSCDEGDGEPGPDPVNVHDIVHGDQGVSYLMVCPQQEGEGGGEVTCECLRRQIDGNDDDVNIMMTDHVITGQTVHCQVSKGGGGTTVKI